jgi:hypothetical protein
MDDVSGGDPCEPEQLYLEAGFGTRNIRVQAPDVRK